MKWNHLPLAGGIYAQHPKFLDDILLIAREEGKARAEHQRKQEAKVRRRK